MNDIPQGTPRAKLINTLQSPAHDQASNPHSASEVQFGLLISDSRLDDELSVAMIEFSYTPRWLQALNNDPHGFLEKTPFGTLWRGVGPSAVDEHRRSAFIRAVMAGATDIYYRWPNSRTPMSTSRTSKAAPRYAMDLSVMVTLCLSVPECER